MCMVSNTYDQFQPLIPQPTPQTLGSQYPWGLSGGLAGAGVPTIQLSPEQLQQLIDAFHKAVAAARQADQATGAGDCADPTKAQLEARVAELERRLDAMQKALGTP